MSSYYRDTVKDALYPKKKGMVTRRNKYLVPLSPPEMDKEEIRKLRRSLCLSVAVFAAVLNVSSKTVEAWESGINVPSGVALRLLHMIKQNPDILLEYGALNDMTNLNG